LSRLKIFDNRGTCKTSILQVQHFSFIEKILTFCLVLFIINNSDVYHSDIIGEKKQSAKTKHTQLDTRGPHSLGYLYL